jgi:hypothetical protein
MAEHMLVKLDNLQAKFEHFVLKLDEANPLITVVEE